MFLKPASAPWLRGFLISGLPLDSRNLDGPRVESGVVPVVAPDIDPVLDERGSDVQRARRQFKVFERLKRLQPDNPARNDPSGRDRALGKTRILFEISAAF